MSKDRAFPPNPGEEPEKRFTVYIRCENDAFPGAFYAGEVSRILREVAGKVTTGRVSGDILDRNGNTVGRFHTQWRNDPPDVAPPRRPLKG